MTNINFQQKIAVLRILLDIINADGRIDARETFYYKKISKLLGISEEEHSFVDDANSLLCLVEIKNFSKEQKKELAKFMGQQIVVDTDINVNEMAIYELVCQTCDIDVKFEETVFIDEFEGATHS